MSTDRQKFQTRISTTTILVIFSEWDIPEIVGPQGCDITRYAASWSSVVGFWVLRGFIQKMKVFGMHNIITTMRRTPTDTKNTYYTETVYE